MKKRTIKNFFCKKFTYKIGKVKIKSDIELNEEQVNKICNIIDEEMHCIFYGSAYQIARKILYEIGRDICSAEICCNKRKIFVKIISKYP